MYVLTIQDAQLPNEQNNFFAFLDYILDEFEDPWIYTFINEKIVHASNFHFFHTKELIFLYKSFLESNKAFILQKPNFNAYLKFEQVRNELDDTKHPVLYHPRFHAWFGSNLVLSSECGARQLDPKLN